MRNKTVKKLLSLAMVATLAIGLTACGQKKASDQETSNSEASKVESSSKKEEVPASSDVAEDGKITYPLESNETLSFYTWRVQPNPEYASADESPFHTGLEKMTGIDYEWVFPSPGQDEGSALNVMLTEKELPQIMHQGWDLNWIADLLKNDKIWDLTEYLPKYAPDYWAFVNQPKYQAALKAAEVDGKQWGLLCFVEGDYNLFYQGHAVRKDWADECGINLDEVVTLEDWEEMLTTFKDKYGAKMVTPTQIMTGTGAHATLSATLYVENGVIKFANSEPEWKKYLAVLHDWWEKDLIDKDTFTMDATARRTKAANNQVSVIYGAMSQMTNLIQDAEGTGAEWVGIGFPRTAKGATIETLGNGFSTYWRANVAAVITKSASEEEMILALKALNYGFTEEGIKYWNFGEEGVSYNVNADGSIEWTDVILKDEGGLNNAITKYTGSDSVPCSVQLSEFVQKKNNPIVAEAVYTWTENHDSNKYALPMVTMTDEELMKYTDAWAAISTYVKEMALKFITGEESLDNWDTYLKTVEEYGIKDVLETYQAAYDRAMNR